MKIPTSDSSGQSSGKFLVLVLLVALAGLGAWAFLLKRDLATVNEALAAAQKSANTTVASAGEVQRLKLKVAELEARIAAGPGPAAAPASVPPPAAAPAAPANAMGALTSQMLSNPTMRSMVATQLRRNLETQYTEFFNRQGFGPEQRERFLDIMLENQDAMLDLSQRLLAGNLSAADRADLQQKGRAIGEAAEGRLREFFGDDGRFQAYRQYADQAGERTQVTALQTALIPAGQGLSTQQSAALTDLMYEERKAFAFTPNPAAGSGDPAAAVAPEYIETNLREQEQLQNRIADRAAAVLSPEQLATLRRTQATRLQTLRTSAELSRQILGGRGAAK